MKTTALLFLAVAALLLAFGPAHAARGKRASEGGNQLVALHDGLCDTCLVTMRIMEDALCDEDAVAFIVNLAEKQLCPATPDKEECAQLAEALLPVAMEWLRASATPASLCAAAGVCGTSMLGDALWDKPATRLTDGMDCATCKHVVAGVKDRAATQQQQQQQQQGSLLSASSARAAALSACQQLPRDLAAACASQFDKRGALLRLAVGASADRDTTAACELMGMCVSGLMRFRPLPLSAPLVAHVAEAKRGPLGAAHAMLAKILAEPSLRDNRCDVCKLTVLEVATLLANPGFQDSVRAYAEAMCDSAAPATIAPTCRTYVDTYAPLLFTLLQQYVQPDAFCVKVHMCVQPSAWEQLVLGLSGGVRGALGKVLGANLP